MFHAQRWAKANGELVVDRCRRVRVQAFPLQDNLTPGRIQIPLVAALERLARTGNLAHDYVAHLVDKLAHGLGRGQNPVALLIMAPAILIQALIGLHQWRQAHNRLFQIITGPMQPPEAILFFEPVLVATAGQDQALHLTAIHAGQEGFGLHRVGHHEQLVSKGRRHREATITARPRGIVVAIDRIERTEGQRNIPAVGQEDPQAHGLGSGKIVAPVFVLRTRQDRTAHSHRQHTHQGAHGLGIKVIAGGTRQAPHAIFPAVKPVLLSLLGQQDAFDLLRLHRKNRPAQGEVRHPTAVGKKQGAHRHDRHAQQDQDGTPGSVLPF